MTPNELELIQKAFLWVREPGYLRQIDITTHNITPSWIGEEITFKIWCWDEKLREGFYIREINDKFLTQEEMYAIKRKKLKEQIEEM